MRPAIGEVGLKGRSALADAEIEDRGTLQPSARLSVILSPSHQATFVLAGIHVSALKEQHSVGPPEKNLGRSKTAL